MLKSDENIWMEKAMKLIIKGNLENNDWVSWAAFFASQQTTNCITRMVSHVMPILLQKVSDPATVAHVLKIACGVTQYLNPGHVIMVETS